MSDITPIRPEGEFNPADENTDPLENLLDEESDEDFGYVVTRDRATGPDGHPVKLAEWSAQDFASIYTRFRPHLERHARRFLHNPSQVDEVVQDAFLYLMVSLPELDSEIGVLRFLKWKVRLLCLDVIRASGKAHLASIDDVAEPVSSDPEVSSYLEQQDDAAVLRLALSKLNPRHREVLLASIYEEKSTEQIAAQVGLSENATRQLIFRARAAFKKALLGDDVNTNGMSAAAILSVAARKAAAEAKKVGAQAMVFVLFLMLAIGAFVNFTGRGTQTQQVAQGGTETQAPNASEAPVEPAPTASVEASGEVVQNLPSAAPSPVSSVKPAASATVKPSASPSPFTQSALRTIFDSVPESSAIRKAASGQDATVRQQYTVTSSQGVVGKFFFDSDAEKPFDSLTFTFEIDGKKYIAYPAKADFARSKGKDGSIRFRFIGQLNYVTDAAGNVYDYTKLALGLANLDLLVSEDSKDLISAALAILPAD
jgi:RNA polymerase sigma-70 factor (ECF subfamily)